MEWTRRQVIARMAALTGVALTGSAIREKASVATAPDTAEAVRAAAVRAYYRLIPVWHRMPEGADKELMFKEAYRLSVAAGLIVHMRSPKWDRELGMEMPLEAYRLPRAERERLLRAGWH